ncbi:MAG: peptide deformylase [Bacteroidetes bacterium GWA2_31_9b]|nr:MAG: peptide deformylase [Bacteroidetes bacterium GWA2_31_9b]
MPVKEILLLGNPLLREKSKDVVDFDSQLNTIIDDLRDTLIDFQKRKKIGRGIAAPQIGILKKIIYIHLSNRSFALINPEVIEKSTETFEVWDSCFSFNVAFFVLTKRYTSITVKYQNQKGEILTEKFSDDLSELVQHEIDHLHGILATDYLVEKNQIIMRKEWEKIKK